MRRRLLAAVVVAVVAGGMGAVSTGSASAASAAGVVDEAGPAPDVSFQTNLGSGFDDVVNRIASLPDGGTLVQGDFTSFNGSALPGGLVRLNSDGTLDSQFIANLSWLSSESWIYRMFPQPDGRTFLTGEIIVNGVTKNLARINPDGTLDTEFDSGVGSGFMNGYSTSVAVLPDGDIVVVGGFRWYQGWNRAYGIVRLNPDGSRDTEFDVNLGIGFANAVNDVVVQADGKILVTDGITFNGAPTGGLFRLHADGTPDAAFNTTIGTAFGVVDRSHFAEIRPLPDGRILAAGEFREFNGAPASGLVLLNADGTLDTQFEANISRALRGYPANIEDVLLRPNGQIFASGSMSGGHMRLMMFNADGTADTTFNSHMSPSLNGPGQTLAQDTQGRILVGGLFTAYQDTPAPGILALNPVPVVHFPDANLRACLNTRNLGQPADAVITKAQAASIRPTVNCVHFSIADLTGAESLTNMENLVLDLDEIEDLTPLAGLKKLQYVAVAYSRVKDVSPLAGLTNLRELILNNAAYHGVGDNGITDLSPLADLHRLRELDVRHQRAAASVTCGAEYANPVINRDGNPVPLTGPNYDTGSNTIDTAVPGTYEYTWNVPTRDDPDFWNHFTGTLTLTVTC